MGCKRAGRCAVVWFIEARKHLLRRASADFPRQNAFTGGMMRAMNYIVRMKKPLTTSLLLLEDFVEYPA
jgi:hypothetical protein